jgi:transcriptional regulator with XRE-family HTH domain
VQIPLINGIATYVLKPLQVVSNATRLRRRSTSERIKNVPVYDLPAIDSNCRELLEKGQPLTSQCKLYRLTFMERLGPYMRRRRDELDLSLREFAKRLHCSAAFISDIELGRRYPSEKVLAEIARVLEVKLEELRAMDVRAPIDDIKRLTENDPRFALAFRTMIDKKVSADELLKLANQKKDERQPKHKK